jgi:hypothetical protein
MTRWAILTGCMACWTVSSFCLGWATFNPSTFSMPLFYTMVATFTAGTVAVVVAAELQVRENRKGLSDDIT